MTMSLLWMRIAVALYGGAALTAAVWAWRPDSRTRRLLPILLTGGMLFHFVSLVELLNQNHHWMPMFAHELESLLGLMLAGIFAWSIYRYGSASIGLFILPLVFLLSLPPAIGPDFSNFFSPRLRNGWVLLHIALILTAYAALLFSLVASSVYLLEEQRLKHKRMGGFLRRLPSLETMEQMAGHTLMFGFFCMTLGLLTGSLLAESTTGPAYFRDPKVLLSFALWLLFAFLVYVRRSAGVRGRRAAYFAGAMAIVAVSVWAANALSSVHRFGAP